MLMPFYTKIANTFIKAPMVLLVWLMSACPSNHITECGSGCGEGFRLALVGIEPELECISVVITKAEYDACEFPKLKVFNQCEQALVFDYSVTRQEFVENVPAGESREGEINNLHGLYDFSLTAVLGEVSVRFYFEATPVDAS